MSPGGDLSRAGTDDVVKADEALRRLTAIGRADVAVDSDQGSRSVIGGRGIGADLCVDGANIAIGALPKCPGCRRDQWLSREDIEDRSDIRRAARMTGAVHILERVQEL